MELLHRTDLSNDKLFVLEVKSCFEDMIYFDNDDLLNIKYIFFTKDKDIASYRNGSSFRCWPSLCKLNKTNNVHPNGTPEDKERDIIELARKEYLKKDDSFINALLYSKENQVEIEAYDKLCYIYFNGISSDYYFQFSTPLLKEIVSLNKEFELKLFQTKVDSFNKTISYYRVEKLSKGNQIIKDI